jgi:glycosyltransferase involved in cell wall biosynthesis
VPLIVVEHQPNALRRRSEWVATILAMMFADKVVLLTPAYAEELRAHLGFFFREDKVSVIPNGIDTTVYAPQPKSLGTNRAIQMGMAARFTESKRQDVLVMMMCELQKEKLNIGWKLTLAGAGVNWEAIRQLVSENRIETLVDFPGQLDERQLIDWYRSLDIYLHASDGETLSTALLQAMSMALPIVATDVPGIRNLLARDPPCGIMISEQDPLKFAAAVRSIIENPRYVTEIGVNGREVAIKYYGHMEMFTQYNNLIFNLHRKIKSKYSL